MIHRATLAAASLALLISAARADEPRIEAEPKKADALDIVPAEAVAAIAIRSVSELTKRGDEFITKTDLKVPMRLSEAYRFVTTFLGISKGLDENGSAALQMMSSEFNENAFVLAVPVKDFEAMASNFRMPRERLVPGKVVDRKEFQDVSSMPFVRYLAVRGNHLLMGGDPKKVELAASGRTLRESLSKDERETLARDDILLYGNTKSVKDEWEKELKSIYDELDDFPPDEAEAARQVAAASKELNYAVAGLRLDQGLGATVLLRFEGDESRGILTKLQGGKATTTLAGLPTGRVLAAHASSGDGDKSAAVARALVRFLMKSFSIKTDEFVSAGHRSNVVGVFGEGWQRVNGSRTALYENDNPKKDGLFSLIAVLDTDNAEQFVTDMTGLARFINASGFSPDDFGETIDAKTIRMLITELGHDEYRVRQMATTKLGLIGRPALAALERAADSSDVEVKFRARALQQQINTSLAAEREDLIKRDLLSRIKPNFVYFPKAESRADRPVDIVQLRLQLDESPVAPRLQRLLGPDWGKLRMATVGNQIVVLLGSNTQLFEKAITNTKSGDLGFQAESLNDIFRKRAGTERTVEFHLSLARAQQLVAAETASAKPSSDATSTTSFGLSIAPQRIRFDLFSPYEELKAVVSKFNW